MVKKCLSYLLSLFCLAGWLTSCSDMPESAQLIPNDAALVLSVNIAEGVENSGLSDHEEVQKEMQKLLRKSDLKRKTREAVEVVLEDPAKAGIDLREPLQMFVSDGFKYKLGFVGSVLNADDLTTLINALADEDKDDKIENVNVIKASELSYAQLDRRTYIMFDETKFLVSEGEYGADEDEILDEMEGLFQQKEEQNILGNAAYQAMCGKAGVLKLAVLGEGIDNVNRKDLPRELRNVFKAIDQYNGKVKLKDLAMLAALEVKDGEVVLHYETMALSDEAKEAMAEGEKTLGDIEGKYLNYVPEDAMLVMATHVNGDAYADLMKDLLKEMGEEMGKNINESDLKEILKLVRSVKGDFTFVMDAFKKVPSMAFYGATADNSIVAMVEQFGKGEFQSVGKDTWQYPIQNYQRVYLEDEDDAEDEYVYTDYSTGQQYVYRNVEIGKAVWGFKNNTSYVVFGEKPVAFKNAAKAMDADLMKGKKMYARFNVDPLLKLDIWKEKDVKEDSEAQLALKLLSLFDYSEFNYEGDGKCTWRVVMKDKSQSPFKTIVDQLSPMMKL